MFRECKTIEDAKSLYRELLKKNHPDKGGTHEETVKIVNQFEQYLQDFIYGRVRQFEQKIKREKDQDINIDDLPFAEILKKIINYNITIEIIGFWIYCFNSYDHKDCLKDLGFWFSRKHKAWVFSGRKKKNVRSRLKTDEVRSIHGSYELKDREDQEKIA